MSDLPDLFPGFAAASVATAAGDIHARVGGAGPPLLLLHGYPQTHVMWHRLVPALAQHFRLVLADLPGYGQSAAPPPAAGHWPSDKRASAAAMIEVMAKLGSRGSTLLVTTAVVASATGSPSITRTV